MRSQSWLPTPLPQRADVKCRVAVHSRMALGEQVQGPCIGGEEKGWPAGIEHLGPSSNTWGLPPCVKLCSGLKPFWAGPMIVPFSHSHGTWHDGTQQS